MAPIEHNTLRPFAWRHVQISLLCPLGCKLRSNLGAFLIVPPQPIRLWLWLPQPDRPILARARKQFAVGTESRLMDGAVVTFPDLEFGARRGVVLADPFVGRAASDERRAGNRVEGGGRRRVRERMREEWLSAVHRKISVYLQVKAARLHAEHTDRVCTHVSKERNVTSLPAVSERNSPSCDFSMLVIG